MDPAVSAHPDSIDKSPNAKSKPRQRVTTRRLAKMRQQGERIAMLTAYDYPMAKRMDAAGVDIVLVGDSLGMVVQGHESTLKVTMDQMIYHAEMVGRAVDHAMVIVDLPFPEGQLSIDRTLEAATRVLQETRCQGVKLEGGSEQSARIEALVAAGVPVMAHVGLRPQSIHVDGGYRMHRDRDRLVADARAAQNAGAFAVLVECVPPEIGKGITDALEVPTIGIGAGPHVSGQVLVTPDVLGMTAGHVPKFVKQFGDAGAVIDHAIADYVAEVKDAKFPS
ncbi:MAG: 3-methyl-2-oxobutanoate hydroxymethyltransferase [Planctomycetota bacterium]